MEDRSTYGLRLDQLAGLFALGAETPPDRGEGEQRMAELLQEHLTAALPAGPLLVDALVMMVGRLGYDTRSLAGKTLKDLVLDPHSDVGLLRVIKECTKRLSCTLDSKVETAIATVIYYATLASALVYHQKRITQNSYEVLEQSFAALMRKTWISPDLVGLFDRAWRICEAKRREK